MFGNSVQRLPEWAKEPARITRDFVSSLPYRGEGRLCPVCGKTSRKFRSYGYVPREDARCMQCGALERHRFVWLYFSTMTNLFDGRPKRMLHVGAERSFESRLKKQLGTDYLTADLFNPRAMVKMDVSDIQYPDGYFDVIYSSHVLEHVPDDRKAMREFYRVLKPGGWAILLVPIINGTNPTFEDPSVTDPAGRLRFFGQEDHVRNYGADYIDRLREAGFNVKLSTVADLFGEDEIERLGLTAASGDIYYCTKEKKNDQEKG